MAGYGSRLEPLRERWSTSTHAPSVRASVAEAGRLLQLGVRWALWVTELVLGPNV
jgi:hypothetical protein